MHIVITGANRGIGNALMKRYKDAGDVVKGTSRSGGEFAQLDVTVPAQHNAFAASLKNAPVDLLICNAGVYLDKGHQLDTATDFSAEVWAATFAANVTGVFQSVRSLLPNLSLSENPKIAILSSTMASHTRAPGGSYVYRASKAAVLNLGRNLATDLRPRGIAVGIYHPGWVRTDMGGDTADVGISDSVSGLIDRFSELDLQSSGCFRTWDGKDHAY